MSNTRSKYSLANHELQVLKGDYEMATSKLERMNKARQEAENKSKDKGKIITNMESRLTERDGEIFKNIRKIHEQDDKILELESLISVLEKDKMNQRVEYDCEKRNMLDKIHSLEEIVRNEKDLRISWVERFERETKQLSAQSIDNMEMKSRVSEWESRVRHLQVELDNEKKMSETMVKSKKELMGTLNKYIVQCEVQEKDIFAMREVNSHFEELKDQEFKEIREKCAVTEQENKRMEMEIEDLSSRLFVYAD